MTHEDWVWAWVYFATGLSFLFCARMEFRARDVKPGKVMSFIGVGIVCIAVFVAAATRNISWLSPWLAFALCGVGGVLLGVGGIREYVTNLRDKNGTDVKARDLPRGHWGRLGLFFALLTAALFWLDLSVGTRGFLLMAVLACCAALFFGAMWLFAWLSVGLDLWILRRQSRSR